MKIKILMIAQLIDTFQVPTVNIKPKKREHTFLQLKTHFN